MKDGFDGDAGAALKPRPATESGATRPRPARRQTSRMPAEDRAVRFFLSNGGSDGAPVLDQEFKTESEAMLESVKTGKSYFAVSEWRGTVDLSKKLPQIRKEAVAAKDS